jgi:glycosyltransferase involved in cell wall biosynthesis
MRVLYVTRLFSGLESSFHARVWSPTGVPTIYRIIEELDRKHDVRFIFTAKDSGEGYLSSWTNLRDIELVIEGLKHAVFVLVGNRYFPSWWPRKLIMILRDFRHTAVIVAEVMRYKPDLIYCDHANVVAGAVLSHFQKKTPVVFRAMGVYPFMRDVLYSSNAVHRIYRWAYYSPFSLVLCTQDGSGVEPWLSQALRPGTKKEVLLNGTDHLTFIEVLDERLIEVKRQKEVRGKMIVLFVGKLEKYKGCYLFTEAILNLHKRGAGSAVHALIVGTGSEQDEVMKIVRENGVAKSFTFIDRLPHHQVLAAHKLSDVYVSMNLLGNLSNSNLEAIQANDCIIMPDPQIENGIDVVTSELLGDSVVMVSIKRSSTLSNALHELVQSPEKIETLSNKLKEKKGSFLWSWNERINREMGLLNELVRERSY